MHFIRRTTAGILVAIMILSALLISCKKQDEDTSLSTTQTTQPDTEEETPIMPVEPIGLAQVYETTGTKSSLLQQKDSVAITAFEKEDATRQTVYVNSAERYQSYIGYGASLTHASAYLLMQADETTRNEILHALFSREGANLSVVRIPVGASDYIPGNTYFTCDDMPTGKTDTTLANFNLDHDTEIIAIAKEILEINPGITFMASPWSAPAWMKNNRSLFGGGLRSDMYEVYADYLVKFVAEYQKQGITINSLTLVNEPSVGTLSYPTMNMNGEEAATIASYVGSKFEALNLDVDIIAWDYNYGTSYASIADAYFDALYNKHKDTAGKYSNTVAFHGYDGDAYWNSSRKFGMKSGIQKVTQEYGKATIITEITESDVSYDFANNLSWACKNIVLAPCAVQNDGEGNSWNGCSGALYWNLVLDSNGQPCPADHSACFGVISLDSQTQDGVTTYRYSKSSAYYAMAHVSKFLYDVDGVGCYAINATTDSRSLSVLAFYRNDGAVVAAVLNSNNKTQSVDIVIDGRKISYEIPPQSLVTFVDSKEPQTQYSTYHFSNVEMREFSDNQYQFDFWVDCGSDDVQVYFTERDFLTAADVATTVTKAVNGESAKFSFKASLKKGVDYFLWVVGANKRIALPISAPDMSPYIDKNGVLIMLSFGFADKTSHISFCDREGKAAYASNSPIFDESAYILSNELPISIQGFYISPTSFSSDKYYFVVLTAKNGLLKIISKPIEIRDAG